MAPSRELLGWVNGNLGVIGALLAQIIAAIHFFHPQHGFPRLYLLITLGRPELLVHDPRPIAFVLSVFAILLGITLVIFDIKRRWVYAAGMGLMAIYIIGYFAWHLSGHGGFLPVREPHYHGVHPFRAVVSHVTYSVAGVSKFAEATLFVVLATLYRRES
jgi:hypothetical protein